MPRHSSILMLHFNLLFEFLTFALSFNSTSNFKYAPVGRLVPISHRATVTRCAPIRSASSCCVSSKSFLNPRICFGDMSFLYQLLQTMSRIVGVETDVLRFFWFCAFSCPVVVLITVGNGFIFVMVKSTKAVRCFKDVCSSSRYAPQQLIRCALSGSHREGWLDPQIRRMARDRTGWIQVKNEAAESPWIQPSLHLSPYCFIRVWRQVGDKKAAALESII
jgi:hypothetical protein